MVRLKEDSEEIALERSEANYDESMDMERELAELTQDDSSEVYSCFRHNCTTHDLTFWDGHHVNARVSPELLNKVMQYISSGEQVH